MELDLEGKVVLITGAASGIGAATARAFAVEGAHLALVDKNEHGLMELAQELRTTGVAVSHTVADLIPIRALKVYIDHMGEAS